MRCNNLWFGVALTCAALAGCGPAPSAGPKNTAATAQEKPEPAAHKHDHNAPGKHGGPQQLLGNHEYHAELVDNDATGEVAIYITDGEFKPVAAPEKEIFLTASISGQPKEFTLANEGKPSGEPRFVLVDKQLCEAVCKGTGGVRLNATIKGKPYAATYAPAGQADQHHEHGDEPAGKHAGEKPADAHDAH